jgi:hypothetical protein
VICLRERLGEDEPQFPCKLAADVRRVIDGGDDFTHRLAELGEAISVDVLSSSQRRQILVVSASKRASGWLRLLTR